MIRIITSFLIITLLIMGNNFWGLSHCDSPFLKIFVRVTGTS